MLCYYVLRLQLPKYSLPTRATTMPSKLTRITLVSALLTLSSLTSQANEGVINSIETRSQQLTDLSDLIWDLAEVGHQETRPSEASTSA